MRIHLDSRSKVPIYAQIVEQVKSLLAAGVLSPGDQLPTVREVAAELRVNFNTVARAYRLLHDEGVISTQQGRGTFVLARAPGQDQARSRQEYVARMVAGWLAEAERMGIRPAEVDQAWRERFRAAAAEGSQE